MSKNLNRTTCIYLRVSPELKARAEFIAKHSGVSVNEWLNRLVDSATKTEMVKVLKVIGKAA